jgi:hypothetical protein
MEIKTMKNEKTFAVVVLGMLAGIYMGVNGGFGLVEPAVGMATLAAAAATWWAQRQTARRGKEVIDVLLVSPTRKARLRLQLRREDVSRAEVLGRIGMVPLAAGVPGRFRIRSLGTVSWLGSSSFLQNIQKVQDGNSDTLRITVEEEEIDQFDLVASEIWV